MTTAAALIIGDELLVGRVVDTNTPLLARCLSRLGVHLRRVVFLPDEEEIIAGELAATAPAVDWVITSGGLGPTHDDCTVAAVARAFAVPVVRSAELERMIRTLWGSRFTEGALRMADIPNGGRLLYGNDGLLPLVALENVYLLPGIPALFRAKLATLERELHGTPRVTAVLRLAGDESALAPCLAEVAAAHPAVKIGSYPSIEGHGFSLQITLEGEDPGAVERALQALRSRIPRQQVVSVESPGTSGATGAG